MTAEAPVVEAPARVRAARLAAPWDEGEGAALVSAALDYAELAARAARAGADLTAARTRTLWQGNTARAVDDPQFRQVLGAAASRAAVATAAADDLLRRAETGRATLADASLAVVGLAALSRENVRLVFDTLGASSTLARHGLDELWRAQHVYEARDAIIARTAAAAG